MSYFITGTDTGVGKTLVSCALLHAFAAQGKHVAGFKPVAAGCDDDHHNEDAKRLRAASTVQATYGQINPYCFFRPIAPHLAARHAGVRIEFARILASYRELAGQADEVIVEGAGGFCVPLNDKQDSADLARELRSACHIGGGDAAGLPESCLADDARHCRIPTRMRGLGGQCAG